MKTAIALTLSIIPLMLTAQRSNRCSCMDRHTTSFGLDLEEIVQRVNNHPANIQQQLSMLYQVQTVAFQQEDQPAGQPPENIQKEEVVVEKKEEKPVEEKVRVSTQSSRLKKKIRRKRIRLKPTKKARKYKGGCPVFND